MATSLTMPGSFSTGTQFSTKNKIINGNFDFWQRGTSLSAYTGLNFLADRWIANAITATVAYSQQSFTLGQTAVPFEPTYYPQFVTTTSSTTTDAITVGQRIESVRSFAGQNAVLSFWAMADSSRNIAIEFSQNFGTTGSPSSMVTGINVTTVALTTSWTQYKIPVTIPSITGKTLGTDNNDYLELDFWLSAGSNFNSRTNTLGTQAGTFNIAQVQLEPGIVATSYELRPRQQELALCQRYYEKSYDVPTLPGTVTTNGRTSFYFNTGVTALSAPRQIFSVNYRTNKRASATITYYASGTGNSGKFSQDDNSDGSTISTASNGMNGFTIDATNTSTSRSAVFVQWTANAEL